MSKKLKKTGTDLCRSCSGLDESRDTRVKYDDQWGAQIENIFRWEEFTRFFFLFVVRQIIRALISTKSKPALQLFDAQKKSEGSFKHPPPIYGIYATDDNRLYIYI